MKDNTKETKLPALLVGLLQLLNAHQSAFKQKRPYLRSIGLVLGELFSFGRHTEGD